MRIDEGALEIEIRFQLIDRPSLRAVVRSIMLSADDGRTFEGLLLGAKLFATLDHIPNKEAGILGICILLFKIWFECTVPFLP